MPAIVTDAVAQTDAQRSSAATHVVHIAHLTVEQFQSEEVTTSRCSAVQQHSVRPRRLYLQYHIQNFVQIRKRRRGKRL